jgi:glutamate--cysteine ligase
VPRLTREQLIADYHSWGRDPASFLVGAEFERHLLQADGSPLPYFGARGVGWLLRELEPDGWEPYFEGENLIALLRGKASVTLEPGSQFELSTSPYTGVAAVRDEALAFIHRVDRELAGTGVHQVALGYTPWAAIEDVAWVPKGRYAVMRDYLGQTGALAHNMMKGTCATQASYDFEHEEDCAAKVRLATLLGPLTTAMFANSPISLGKPNGYASFRGHIWTQTDPRRTGFPDAAERFSFERWVDWLLDVPMMFYQRQGQWQPARGRTFRDWMGESAHPPEASDWDLHLTSVFPEVRVKRTIEVRGADCVSLPLALSFVALFKGLFYTPAALDRATELARSFASNGTKDERFAEACRHGLKGSIGGKRLSQWAEELVAIARSTFPEEDLAFLAPLEAQIASGESPAHTLLRAWEEDPTVGRLVELAPMG